jgi:hypothetical protein
MEMKCIDSCLYLYRSLQEYMIYSTVVEFIICMHKQPVVHKKTSLQEPNWRSYFDIRRTSTLHYYWQWILPGAVLQMTEVSLDICRVLINCYRIGNDAQKCTVIDIREHILSAVRFSNWLVNLTRTLGLQTDSSYRAKIKTFVPRVSKKKANAWIKLTSK